MSNELLDKTENSQGLDSYEFLECLQKCTDIWLTCALVNQKVCTFGDCAQKIHKSSIFVQNDSFLRATLAHHSVPLETGKVVYWYIVDTGCLQVEHMCENLRTFFGFCIKMAVMAHTLFAINVDCRVYHK